MQFFSLKFISYILIVWMKAWLYIYIYIYIYIKVLCFVLNKNISWFKKLVLKKLRQFLNILYVIEEKNTNKCDKTM
jgi:hypothetical protein